MHDKFMPAFWRIYAEKSDLEQRTAFNELADQIEQDGDASSLALFVRSYADLEYHECQNADEIISKAADVDSFYIKLLAAILCEKNRNFDRAIEIALIILENHQINDIYDQLLNAKVNNLIGYCFLSKGEIDTARDVFMSVVDSYGNSKHIVLKEAVAYAKLNYAASFHRAEELKDAIPLFDLVTKEFGNIKNYRIQVAVGKALHGKAQCLDDLGKYKEAIGILNNIIRKYHSASQGVVRRICINAYIHKGLLQRQLELFKEAMATADTGVSFIEDSKDVREFKLLIKLMTQKAITLRVIGKIEEALEAYDNICEQASTREISLLEKQEATLRALLSKANLLRQIGKLEDAVNEYNKVIADSSPLLSINIKRIFSSALINKGQVLRTTQPNEAISVFDLLLSTFEKESDKRIINDNRRALQAKARLLERIGELPAAKICYLKLLERFPANVGGNLGLARIERKVAKKKGTVTPGLREVVEKVLNKLGDKRKFFESQMQKTDEKFKEFLSKDSRFNNDKALLLTLRRWNSFTPIIPVDGETSRGGGYFIRLYNAVDKRWEGIVIDPGYNFIENFCNAGGRVVDIDHIVITHAHNDHTIDFESLCTLLHRFNKEHKDTDKKKRVKLFMNIGTFLKFSGLLDLRNAKYINRAIVLNVFDKHEILPGVQLYAQPAYHDEIITTDCSVGLLFEISPEALVETSSEEKAADFRYILFTGDTSLYPAKQGATEPEANIIEGQEIHKMYKPDLIHGNSNIELDLLVAHIGSIYKKELDPKSEYEKRFYPNHLGILGVVTLINDLRPKLTLVSEFGEELMAVRLKLVEGIAELFKDEVLDTDNISYDAAEELVAYPVVLPCDLSLCYNIYSKAIYCVDTCEDESVSNVKCFSEDNDLYYKSAGNEDFDRAQVVRQYQLGLTFGEKLSAKDAPATPWYLRKTKN